MKLAALVYIRDGDRTLMLHRNTRPEDYHYGKWNGVGGKLQAGESPEQAARREVLEESGLALGRLEMKGVITFPMFDGMDDWYVFLFNGYEPSGTVGTCAEGELEWVRTSEVLSLNLWPGDRVFLPWMSESGFFSAIFTYRDGAFEGYEVLRY